MMGPGISGITDEDMDMDDRVRTEFRLPVEISNAIEKVCSRTGLTKNTFYTLASIFFLNEVSKINMMGQKFVTNLENINKIFTKELDSYKEKYE